MAKKPTTDKKKRRGPIAKEENKVRPEKRLLKLINEAKYNIDPNIATTNGIAGLLNQTIPIWKPFYFEHVKRIFRRALNKDMYQFEEPYTGYMRRYKASDGIEAYDI
jgi:hypothetical protein